MATVTKTWSFASNAEGFVEVGDLVGIQFSAFSYAGSPSAGCVGFSGNSLRERARTGTGVTWETWGVPAGATVTQVQVTSWRLSTGDGVPVSNGTHKMRIVNSSNTTVHSAGDLVNKTSMPTGWATYTDGTARAVDSSYQASSTNVKLEIEANPSIYYEDAYESFWYESYFDTIELTITYATGGNVYEDAVTISRKNSTNNEAQAVFEDSITIGKSITALTISDISDIIVNKGFIASLDHAKNINTSRDTSNSVSSNDIKKTTVSEGDL